MIERVQKQRSLAVIFNKTFDQLQYQEYMDPGFQIYTNTLTRDFNQRCTK